LAGAQTKLVSAAADVTPPPAPAPEVPKRPADMSPKPPKVTCRGDQISISADNSTLMPSGRGQRMHWSQDRDSQWSRRHSRFRRPRARAGA
jgi:hypothetical protein